MNVAVSPSIDSISQKNNHVMTYHELKTTREMLKRKRHKEISSSNVSLSFTNYRQFLITEAEALLTRLSQVKSFSLTMPMVAAANLSSTAQKSITQLLKEGIIDMHKKVNAFIISMKSKSNPGSVDSQKAFTILKLKFNWLLDSLDIFADVLTLRGEHDTGVWLAGMDVLAEDTLKLKGNFYHPPPLITYLDRGHGAAIRRARTRLPGGKSNPVAVIRVPRERMISTSIASSLVHEVGHQGASLLGLILSLRRTLQQQAENDPGNTKLWKWYNRWISEIISDFWSVAMVGIGSTTGLLGVVSVPSYFVFRLKDDDPHPPPWIRLRLSIAFGAALYPDQQWYRLKKLWDRLYPLRLAGKEKREVYKRLEALIPIFVKLVIHHRPSSLKGNTLKEVFPLNDRQPKQLRTLFQYWKRSSKSLEKTRPSLVFAAIGQARADGLTTPKQEYRLLNKMLRTWALKRHIF